jgi:hypothetical protein
MKLTRFVVDESPRKVLRFTERSGSRCPFWLARPPSERFCSDRGRISGHYTSKGELEIELGFVGDAPVPASHYIHPEFGFFSPTPSFRRRLRVAPACLVVAGVGAAVMATKLAATVTDADEASTAETTQATSLAPFAAAVPRLPIGAGAQTAADKPSCVGDTRTEGNCVSVKLRKPRMVWVANDRPAIAAVALGRSAAPTTGSIDAALLAARTGTQGDPARPGEAAVAAASSTEPQNAVATPKNKKAQKSARGQNHRRDQYRYGAPSWREGRADDWAARGYAPRERDYQRGAYGRGGFTPNFWSSSAVHSSGR